MSNEKMEGIMKIIKLLKESELLLKWINETIKNEAKKQKTGFLSMLLVTLVTRIFGNALTGEGVIRACECTIRSGQEF